MKQVATDSDKDLVSALKRGEIGSFQALFERHRDPMLRVAFRILGNRADAEDAIQDAFLALFRKAAAFRGGSSFNTWFYRIVVNACLKIRRKRRAMRETMENAAIQDGPSIRDAGAADAEARSALDREIEGLPLRQKMVFVLSVVEGFSLKETAEILDLRPGTVGYHLFKARERLRERLRPYLGTSFSQREKKAAAGPGGER